MTPRRPADIDHDHLTWEEVEEVLRHTDTARERKPLFHALARCPDCAENVHPLLELCRRRVIFTDTSFGVIEIAIEEFWAPDLWRRIEMESLEGAEGAGPVIERLKNDRRWPAWGLTAWHARQSLEAARDDPEKALVWAKLAVAGASRLKVDQPAGEDWNAELRAFAHAALGNARRVAGELGKAETSFEQAHRHLDAYPDNTADYLPFRPWVFHTESALLRAQRLYPQALACLDKAYEAWDVVERATPEDKVRVLLQRANLLDELQDPQGALALHEEAAGLLGPEADEAFRLVVVNNLLFYLVRLGRAEEAADWLPVLDELAEAAGNELDGLRVMWVKANVHEALDDDPKRAETLYRKVLDGFCERHIGYDAALVALDLARLLLSRGETDEVWELALSVRPIFETLGVEPDVRRAVRAYLAAREREALEVSLLTKVWWERREER